ncbi:Coenzyme A transferase [Shimia aestuarii]|uniref:Coenzyme A transferase n=1 Tax=Shimia aestuarii TaxID=254406 RepID=A0A1I4T8G1_9RHOB|nr:Coenzyme A transferase [Shimia aestuarii]
MAHDNPKEVIARRVAQEIKPGMIVNLGIGLPSLVAGYVAQEKNIVFHAENGLIGLGTRPPEGMEAKELRMREAGSSAPCPAQLRSAQRQVSR